MKKNFVNIILTAIITVLVGVAITLFNGSSDENDVMNTVKEQVSKKLEQMLSSTELTQFTKESELLPKGDSEYDESQDIMQSKSEQEPQR